jgi:hypothetical protein
MTASCNAKQITDKKADKFWEDISQQFEELVAMTNKLNTKILSVMQSRQTKESSLYATVGSVAYSQPSRNLLGSFTRTIQILVTPISPTTWSHMKRHTWLCCCEKFESSDKGFRTSGVILLGEKHKCQQNRQNISYNL